MLFGDDLESGPTLSDDLSKGKRTNVSPGKHSKKKTGLDMFEEDPVFEMNTDDEDGGTDIESSSVTDILQLDANLRKLKCILHYTQSKRVLPIGRASHSVVAELTLDEIFGLMELKSNGLFRGDAWLMDLSVKEIPTNGYGSLEREVGAEFPHIIHQELYYRKTKPPRLGGGTMDTRRSSPDDTVFKISFDYFQESIKGTQNKLSSYVGTHYIRTSST